VGKLLLRIKNAGLYGRGVRRLPNRVLHMFSPRNFMPDFITTRFFCSKSLWARCSVASWLRIAHFTMSRERVFIKGKNSSRWQIVVGRAASGGASLPLQPRSQPRATRGRTRVPRILASPFSPLFSPFWLFLTPVAGLIFETKNRAIFLERFFGREITAREQLSRAVILARF